MALKEITNKLVGRLKFGDKLKGIGIQTYQRRVHHLLKRYHIVVFIGGFASGKTYLAAREVWYYTFLYPGGLIWILVPTYSVGKPIWDEIKKSCPNDKLIKRIDDDGVPPYIKTIIGTTIELRTTNDPELLRGPAVNFAVYEEGSSHSREAWQIGVSRVAKTGGRVLIIGTQPKTSDHWIQDLRQIAKNTAKDSRQIAIVDGVTTKENNALTKQQIDFYYATMKGVYLKRDLESEEIFSEGRMYDIFSEKEHSYDFLTEEQNVLINSAYKRLYVAIDFGWDKPLGVLWALYCRWEKQNKECLFCLDELYGRFWDNTKLKIEIETKNKEWQAKYPGVSLGILGDPKQPDKIFELVNMGLPVSPAPFGYFGVNYREPTIKFMYDWIFENKFYVSKKCVNMLNEFQKWVRKASGSPIDDFDHLLDCGRQIVTQCEISRKLNPNNKDKNINFAVIDTISWAGNFK
jgi:hypothetical protein